MTVTHQLLRFAVARLISYLSSKDTHPWSQFNPLFASYQFFALLIPLYQ